MTIKIDTFTPEKYNVSDDYVLIIIKSPSSIKIDKTHIYLEKYDTLLIYKKVKFEIICLDAYMIDFSSAYCKKNFLHYFSNQRIIYDFFNMESSSPEYLYFKSSTSKQTTTIIGQILEYEDTFIRLNLLNILFYLLGKYHPTILSKIESSMLKNYLLGAIIKYIDENSKNISLDDVSEKFGYHPAYFSKFFKKHMNISFKDMVKEIRLEKSVKYLLETDFSIKKIAIEVGYDDVNHFYKIFKEKYGVSPKTFKKEKEVNHI